jgi:DNA-binding MarR family transcriptional regulator
MAKALSLPNPTVTFLLKRLEARAYVKRSNEPGDLRKYRFTLTAAGRKALLKGQSILGKRLDAMLGKLSVADRNQLFKLFGSLN